MTSESAEIHDYIGVFFTYLQFQFIELAVELLSSQTM